MWSSRFTMWRLAGVVFGVTSGIVPVTAYADYEPDPFDAAVITEDKTTLRVQNMVTGEIKSSVILPFGYRGASFDSVNNTMYRVLKDGTFRCDDDWVLCPPSRNIALRVTPASVQISSGVDDPWDMCFTPDGKFVVLCGESTSGTPVSVISRDTMTEVDTLTLTNPCTSIVCLNDGQSVVVQEVDVNTFTSVRLRHLTLNASGQISNTGQTLAGTGFVKLCGAPGSPTGVVIVNGNNNTTQLVSFQANGMATTDQKTLSGHTSLNCETCCDGTRVYARTQGNSGDVLEGFNYNTTNGAIGNVSLFTITDIGESRPDAFISTIGVDEQCTKLVASAVSSDFHTVSVRIYNAQTGAFENSFVVDEDPNFALDPVHVGFSVCVEGTTDPPDPDPCPIVAAINQLNRAVQPLGVRVSQVDSANTLTTLRAFRDDVLSRTPEGRALIEAYYEHAWETTAILATRPELARRTVEFLTRAANVLSQREQVWVPRALLDEGLALSREIASHGGDDMQAASRMLEEFVVSRTTITYETYAVVDFGGTTTIEPGRMRRSRRFPNWAWLSLAPIAFCFRRNRRRVCRSRTI